ncbi:MAG TPA: VWA domain-containing protein [Thermoanaerobaculia bacterium]|nr:VWA domain-containing protein [Thermoanaerobaculia bacterium]
MRSRLWLPFLLLATGLSASEPEPILRIAVEPLGDTEEGVVIEIVFRYSLPPEVLRVQPVLQGVIVVDGRTVRNVRRTLRPDESASMRLVETVPVGTVEIEARLLAEQESSVPLMIAKASHSVKISSTGELFLAGEAAPADAILAEGAAAEKLGAVKIRPPRRDVAPHLFIVDVDVRPPAVRVEFWVEGKKLFTRNSAPYRAELDLGSLPRRVEVKVIGYDRSGRYVDADSWIVNERDTPLEVSIVRTVTADGVNHFKLSIQNPRNVTLTDVVLFAEERKLGAWSKPPYAIDIPGSALAGVEFVRVTARGADGYEASDLLYLSGDRYVEEIEVNLVELPVSLIDGAGLPVTDLEQKDFQIFEDGKSQKLANFAFSSDLPLSVGVLVDHSGSMKSRIEDARAAALGFFREIIGEKDRGFFGGFSWEASSISPFVSDLTSLEAQVGAMPEPEGATALYDAIVTGLYRFRTINGRKAMVLVTDGDDTASRIPYEGMLEYVRAARVPLYFIGIGISRFDRSASGKLKTLAAETGGVAYFVRDVKELDETYAAIERELRTQYLLSYYTESSGTDRDYRTVEVRVNRPGVTVRTIRGFLP